jgi:hypothetical protein
MIARLAWRLSGLAIDVRLPDGDSMRFPKVSFVGVCLTYMY